MKDRRGVIMILFDIPVKTKTQRREYNSFKKHLKTNGYIFMQESVYIKLLHNFSKAEDEIKKFKNSIPVNGNVITLPLCLSDFLKYRNLSGGSFDFDVFSNDTVYI